MKREEIDVRAVVADSRVSALQVLVILLCGAIITVDGLDIQALGYVAPALGKAWKLRPGALGVVFSANTIGMMIGALGAGVLSDRLGRKPVLVAATLWFGLCSLATAGAETMQQLTVIRLVTGIGLGAVMPTAIALTSEFAPARRRGTFVILMFCGQSLGSALGGAVAAELTPHWGWQSVFVVGGVLPLVLAALAVVFLPEAPHLMVRLGAPADRIRKLMTRIAPARVFADDTVFVAPVEEKGSSLQALFRHDRARTTLPIWCFYICNLLVIFLLANWMPSLINSTGLSVEISIYVSILYHLGAIAAALCLGLVVDRLGAFRTLAAVFLLAACLVAALGSAGGNVGLLAPLLFAAGFCVVGGQSVANAAAAASYPDHARSTGVGWALGVGRIGSIIGPGLGGYLIAQGVGTADLLRLAALPELVAAAAAAFILVNGRRKVR